MSFKEETNFSLPNNSCRTFRSGAFGSSSNTNFQEVQLATFASPLGTPSFRSSLEFIFNGFGNFCEDQRLENYRAARYGNLSDVKSIPFGRPFCNFPGSFEGKGQNFAPFCPFDFNGVESVGTATRFVPLLGEDTICRHGILKDVPVKLQCITGMKHYENKSLEELRLEDYLLGRHGRSSGMIGNILDQESKLKCVIVEEKVVTHRKYYIT